MTTIKEALIHLINQTERTLDAQQVFFKTRSKPDLNAAKKQEQILRDMLNDYRSRIQLSNKEKQLDIFNTNQQQWTKNSITKKNNISTEQTK